jgi:tetratricopeptide (TPR) repeat protein
MYRHMMFVTRRLRLLPAVFFLLKAAACTATPDDWSLFLARQPEGAAWLSPARSGFSAYEARDEAAAALGLEQAWRLGCRDPLLVFKLANLHERRGEGARAIELYSGVGTNLAVSYPGHPAGRNLFLNLGNIHFRRGVFPAALAAFEEAFRIDRAPEAAFRIGSTHLKLSNYSLAAAHLELADREDFRVLYALGSAYHSLGRRPAAIEALVKATGLRPDAVRAWMDLGHLLLAEAQQAGEQPGAVLEETRAAYARAGACYRKVLDLLGAGTGDFSPDERELYLQRYREYLDFTRMHIEEAGRTRPEGDGNGETP